MDAPTPPTSPLLGECARFSTETRQVGRSNLLGFSAVGKLGTQESQWGGRGPPGRRAPADGWGPPQGRAAGLTQYPDLNASPMQTSSQQHLTTELAPRPRQVGCGDSGRDRGAARGELVTFGVNGPVSGDSGGRG